MTCHKGNLHFFTMLTAVRHEDIITLWLYIHHTGIQPSGDIGRTVKKNRMITFN